MKILGMFLVLASLSLVQSVQAKTSYEKFPTPKKGGTLIDITTQTPITLNPILITNLTDRPIAGYLYMNLLDKDWDNHEDMPSLADKVEASKDKKEYTFTLNKNAKWADGTPVTSDDVEYTFQRIMDTKVEAAALRSFLGGVTFEKMSPTQFKFKFPVAKYNSLDSVSSFTVIQKKQFEKESDFNKSRENLHPIGNGPYKLKSISRDQVVTLERDQNWWAKDLPQYKSQYNFDVIQFKIIADPALQYENFLKGNIDLINFTSDQFATQVNGGDKDKIGDKATSGKPIWANKFLNDGASGWFGAALNLQRPVLASVKVRQALAQLVDYDTIIERAYFKLAIQSVTPFGSRTNNVAPELKSGAKKYKYDLKKAAELLKSDGWADTDKDGVLDKVLNGKKTALKLEVKYFVSNPSASKAAQMMKETFKKAGVELQLRPVDGSALYKDFDDKNFDMAFIGWGGGSIYPDPRQNWHTDSIANGGSNTVGYSNKKVDQLIDQANVEFNRKKREKLLQEIGREIYNEVPYIFLIERPYILEGLNSKLKAPVWNQRYNYLMAKELYHF